MYFLCKGSLHAQCKIPVKGSSGNVGVINFGYERQAQMVELKVVWAVGFDVKNI